MSMQTHLTRGLIALPVTALLLAVGALAPDRSPLPVPVPVPGAATAEAIVVLPRTVEWSALSAVRLAVIDQALAVRAAQWPEIFASLVERAARRAERLVVMQAIAHLTRVDDRLLALLWCLAER
mgnify:CR=1 FL=1